MITELLEIIKKNLFLIFLIVLTAFLSFYLGRISKTSGEPIRIEKASIQEIFNQQNVNMQIDANAANGGIGKDLKIDFRVVASKKSTSMRYHFLWCPGAKQMKEENKIYFDSEEAAISAGYSLAGNCVK